MSEENPSQFSLYRVFRFCESPRLFMLDGSLKESCVLDATQYKALLR